MIIPWGGTAGTRLVDRARLSPSALTRNGRRRSARLQGWSKRGPMRPLAGREPKSPELLPSFSTGVRAGRADLEERMSIAPWKVAPSAMPILGATRSPSTAAVSRMLMFSVAVMLPRTLPITTTVLASAWALSVPFWPIVSTLWSRSTLPSTNPSIVISSFAVSSPVITTDCPMMTLSIPCSSFSLQ